MISPLERAVNELETMLLLIGAGLLMMGIGFNWRQEAWGVALIALGVLCALGTLGYKMVITFG